MSIKRWLTIGAITLGCVSTLGLSVFNLNSQVQAQSATASAGTGDHVPDCSRCRPNDEGGDYYRFIEIKKAVLTNTIVAIDPRSVERGNRGCCEKYESPTRCDASDYGVEGGILYSCTSLNRNCVCRGQDYASGGSASGSWRGSASGSGLFGSPAFGSADPALFDKFFKQSASVNRFAK